MKRQISRFWATCKSWFGNNVRQSRTINNEPLNKFSLIVIIIVDIFILSNVFIGLNDISQWPLSPSQAYPCYTDWQVYRDSQPNNSNQQTLRIITSAVQQGITQSEAAGQPLSLQAQYRQAAVDHLGEVSGFCLQYAERYDQIATANYASTWRSITQKKSEITALEAANQKIREQYDSSLLEELAGQPRDQAITNVGADQARQKLEANTATIATLKQEVTNLETSLINQPASQELLKLLDDSTLFQKVDQGYQSARFWYPNFQLFLQIGFLLPLILLATAIHRYAQSHDYGLLSLLSWHLLAIFYIPLLIKGFELFRINLIFDALFSFIQFFFGSLVFLVSYLYILLIPVVGFGIIKISQTWIFNPRSQAANRVQKSRCIRCAKRLAAGEAYCPHCGYHQYVQCDRCQNMTYQYLPYCRVCGSATRPTQKL